MNQQDKNEIRIFNKFAEICPYPIRLNSVVKKKPPKPDIFCELTDGNTIAFELVECIDDDIAKAVFSSLKLKKLFNDKLNKLPRVPKKQFKANFENALIYIAFNKNLSFYQKGSAIKEILEYLLTLGNTAEGDFDLRFNNALRNIVKWISISRGVSGPIFDVENVTFFADPCSERIESKFKKYYEKETKVELLAYYELQPVLPDNHWVPSVKTFIKNNIERSVFQRVWIYSATKNNIILDSLGI